MPLMLLRVLALQAGEGAEEAETGCLQMGATSLYGGHMFLILWKG